MIHTRYGILAIIILVGMSLITNKVHAREFVYRPVTLTVLDAETREPIEGITVTIVNYYYYSIPFLIDSIHGSKGYMYKYVTDVNGMVEISSFVISGFYIDISPSQYIVLNLEYRGRTAFSYRKQVEKFILVGDYTEPNDFFPFFRPNAKYKAGEIVCLIVHNTNAIDFISSKQRESSIPYITEIKKIYLDERNERDQTDFLCEHEAFTFYLEHFQEGE